MTLIPIEGSTEQLTFHMTVNVLALDTRTMYWMIHALKMDPSSFPPMLLMPTGYVPRLASSDLAAYQVISDRNLLQTARGGIDRADYTVLTGMIYGTGGDTEVWFTVGTNDSRITAKLGDQIQSGSFSGRLVEIVDQDIVIVDREGKRWLLSVGERLNQAFALPPETAGEW